MRCSALPFKHRQLLHYNFKFHLPRQMRTRSKYSCEHNQHAHINNILTNARSLGMHFVVVDSGGSLASMMRPWSCTPETFPIVGLVWLHPCANYSYMSANANALASYSEPANQPLSRQAGLPSQTQPMPESHHRLYQT